jgi:hypothetical protein
MNDKLLFELMRKRLTLLKQFRKALTEERDAIISFSLEGIIGANNVKEEILKKLEFLDEESQRLTTENPSPAPQSSDDWISLKHELETSTKDVKAALEKNMKLVSFSIDHVKGSIEHIVKFIGTASYGKRRDTTSFMISRTI